MKVEDIGGNRGKKGRREDWTRGKYKGSTKIQKLRKETKIRRKKLRRKNILTVTDSLYKDLVIDR
jgi:hypothetical protein